MQVKLDWNECCKFFSAFDNNVLRERLYANLSVTDCIKTLLLLWLAATCRILMRKIPSWNIKGLRDSLQRVRRNYITCHLTPARRWEIPLAIDKEFKYKWVMKTKALVFNSTSFSIAIIKYKLFMILTRLTLNLNTKFSSSN